MASSRWDFDREEATGALPSALRGAKIRDDSWLRLKAQEAVRAGRLPRRRPTTTLVGPGSGGLCTACGEPVKPDEIEFEIAQGADGDGFEPDDLPGDAQGRRESDLRLHRRCFTAWEQELQPDVSASSEARGGITPEASGGTTSGDRCLSSTADDATLTDREVAQEPDSRRSRSAYPR